MQIKNLNETLTFSISILMCTFGATAWSAPTYSELKGLFDNGTALTFSEIPNAGVLAATSVEPNSTATPTKIAFTNDGNIVRSTETPVDLANEDAVRQLQVCTEFIPPAGVNTRYSALVQWNFMPDVRAIAFEGNHNWSGLLQGTIAWRTVMKDGKKVWVGRVDDADNGYGIPDISFPHMLASHATETRFIVGEAVVKVIPSGAEPNCHALVRPYRFVHRCASVVVAGSWCVNL